MTNTVSDLVVNRRKELGLTQKQLADKLGYQSAQYISNIERGTTNVTPAMVQAFAIALGLGDEIVEAYREYKLYLLSVEVTKLYDSLQNPQVG